MPVRDRVARDVSAGRRCRTPHPLSRIAKTPAPAVSGRIVEFPRTVTRPPGPPRPHRWERRGGTRFAARDTACAFDAPQPITNTERKFQRILTHPAAPGYLLFTAPPKPDAGPA